MLHFNLREQLSFFVTVFSLNITLSRLCNFFQPTMGLIRVVEMRRWLLAGSVGMERELKESDGGEELALWRFCVSGLFVRREEKERDSCGKKGSSYQKPQAALNSTSVSFSIFSSSFSSLSFFLLFSPSTYRFLPLSLSLLPGHADDWRPEGFNGHWRAGAEVGVVMATRRRGLLLLLHLSTVEPRWLAEAGRLARTHTLTRHTHTQTHTRHTYLHASTTSIHSSSSL